MLEDLKPQLLVCCVQVPDVQNLNFWMWAASFYGTCDWTVCPAEVTNSIFDGRFPSRLTTLARHLIACDCHLVATEYRSVASVCLALIATHFSVKIATVITVLTRSLRQADGCPQSHVVWKLSAYAAQKPPFIPTPVIVAQNTPKLLNLTYWLPDNKSLEAEIEIWLNLRCAEAGKWDFEKSCLRSHMSVCDPYNANKF